MPDMNDFNGRIVAEFRANHGQVGGNFAGAPMLLLHTVGARSGASRVSPMMYMADGERYLVFASKAGADSNPDWYHNVIAHPDEVRIEVGDETLAVRAVELRGAERDAQYAEQARRYPGFAEYERMTSRVIPVIALVPAAASSDADTAIAALRAGHDGLVALVAGLDDGALTGPSGATDWDISQVLSHLGSGAEISAAGVRAALDGAQGPGSDFNPTVWDRWNAMSPRERADGFPTSNAALVELYEAMDADIRENLRIDLGFLPAPVDVATAARMRLSEFALHSWDVRVAYDADATLAPEAVGPLLQSSGALLGWIGKADRLKGKYGVIEVTTTEPSSVFALHLAEQISLEFGAPEKHDGTLALPAEAWVRLVAGRLAPEHTPAGITTTGDADLELLREVFPGY